MLEFMLMENSLLVPCTNYLNSEVLEAELLKNENLLKAFEIRKSKLILQIQDKVKVAHGLLLLRKMFLLMQSNESVWSINVYQ